MAEKYDQKRLGNNFGKYKHFAEVKSILKLLPDRFGKILEVGAGTGRITQELVRRGYSITAVEPSKAMLAQYQRKKGLPKPLLLKDNQLPFEKESFETVLSIRVFWHIQPLKKREKFLQEISRVSARFVILDIVNQKRWLGQFLINHQTYSTELAEFKANIRKNGLKIDSIIPLDVCLPVWLNLLPQKLAIKLYLLLYRLDLSLARLIPPGRYLLRLVKLKEF